MDFIGAQFTLTMPIELCLWAAEVLGCVLVMLMFDVAPVLLGEHVVVLFLLLQLLTEGTLMLISGFRLNWDHSRWSVVLARVQGLPSVRLHLEYQVPLVDIRLTGSECC